MSVEIIIFSTSRARVDGDFNEEALDKRLRYRPEGVEFMPRYNERNAKGDRLWDGYIHLLAQPANTFPLGLLHRVKKFFDRKGIRYTVKDERPEPRCKPRGVVEEFGGIKLYDHQKAAVAAALKRGRGVIKVATGGGKTEIEASIILSLETLDLPKTLVMVPSRRLLKQTAERLSERLGTYVGMIGFGKWAEAQVTVAIPDTLAAKKFARERARLMARLDLLLLDETHHSASKKWAQPLRYCKAHYRFGLSANPLDRTDGKNVVLMAQTGPLLISVSARSLIKKGLLAKPKVFMRTVRKPQLPANLPYSDAYALGVDRSLHFARAILADVQACVKDGLTTLVLVRHIAQGDNLSAVFQAAGVEHRFLHGQVSELRIEKTMKRFARRELPVLIASPIFGEGVDVPAIDALVIAAGEAAVIPTLQKVGRALRVKKDRENRCRIYDYLHLTHPDLEDHARTRMATYRREGFPICEC